MTTMWYWQKLAGVMSVCAALGIAGCDEPGEADLNLEVLNDGEVANDDHLDFTPVDDTITFRGVGDNGTATNGTALNGRMFNGRMFNGRMFNGTALATLVERINGALTASIMLNSSALTNIELVNGSLLRAFDTGAGATKIGAQLTGTTFRINFDPTSSGVDGELVFKIKSVAQSAVQSDVYFHEVEQLDENDEFGTLCRDGAGNPTQAIALPGTWDPDTAIRQPGAGKFTWGCRGASLAKAVEWGYRPWVSATMNDAHEAAMRMIRADYCGDGVTHTTNGNPIDVSDKWNIQVSDTTWDVEAKWGPNGAVCLNTPRKLQWPRASIPCAASLPYCTSNGLANGTPNTDPAQYGGLLMTRAVPNDNASAY
jgi:hypothetical protein